MIPCGNAGDEVCQDGGWKAFGSMCEFGTDCSDCGSRLLPPGIDVEATGDSVTAQDAGPGLALGLALGGCLLVRSWRCWRSRGHIRLAPQAPHAAIAVAARSHRFEAVGVFYIIYRVNTAHCRLATHVATKWIGIAK